MSNLSFLANVSLCFLFHKKKFLRNISIKRNQRPRASSAPLHDLQDVCIRRAEEMKKINWRQKNINHSLQPNRLHNVEYCSFICAERIEDTLYPSILFHYYIAHKKNGQDFLDIQSFKSKKERKKERKNIIVLQQGLY